MSCDQKPKVYVGDFGFCKADPVKPSFFREMSPSDLLTLCSHISYRLLHALGDGVEMFDNSIVSNSKS